MIESKKWLFVAILLLFLSLILNLPFPHNDAFGETLATMLDIPIKSAQGFHYVGIFSLLVFITGLYFLTKSVNNYHGRVVLLAIIIVLIAPSMLVDAYQKTFASGIYAVSYKSEESTCYFHMVNKTTLLGECELPFENYSDNDIRFTVEFYEAFVDDMPMVSLLNKDVPYEVTLQGKERRVIRVRSRIDVSKMENHIVGGNASQVNIILKSGGKVRRL